MYVCIKLFIKFDEPYSVVPAADVFQAYSAAEERLRPYLDDGFEVVCIEPDLFCADEGTLEPQAYYDTGRFVYMVKELEDVTAFDRNRYLPDNYECTLMYEHSDWVYEQVYCFRRENDPFSAWESLPFREFPCWPDTIAEQADAEKAAEKERIQMLCNAVRGGEVKLEDLDIIDLLIIRGMMHKELSEKERAVQWEKELFEKLMRLRDQGAPLEELQHIYKECQKVNTIG